MATVAIPGWNGQGLLPPIDDLNPTTSERSPYEVSLLDLVMRFGISDERRYILNGFLNYRAALHAAGLTSGFQWVDGSFMENIELIEMRCPKDIDVVTFFEMPPGSSQADLKNAHPGLFPSTSAEKTSLKAAYSVDAFVMVLSIQPTLLVTRSAYWYSMWSHRRNRLWKGYLQLSLHPGEDAAANAELATLGLQVIP
jgi:hypothetical protein